MCTWFYSTCVPQSRVPRDQCTPFLSSKPVLDWSPLLSASQANKMCDVRRLVCIIFFFYCIESPPTQAPSYSVTRFGYKEPVNWIENSLLVQALPGFIETIRLGLGGPKQAPGGSERGSLESWSFAQSQDMLCTGYGILSQGSRNVLCWLKLVSAFRDRFGSALQVFGHIYICTVNLACPCLHRVLLIGPRNRDPECAPLVRLGDFMSLLSTTFWAHPCLVGYGQGVFLKGGWYCFVFLCSVCTYR